MPPHQDVQCGGRGWAGSQEKTMGSSRGREDEEGETGAVDWKGKGEEHSEERSISPPSIIL